jgi:hypothetical protein
VPINTNGHEYLETFYSHKIWVRTSFSQYPRVTQSKTRRISSHAPRKRARTRGAVQHRPGTDCTSIQQDVRTAHPNIRVSVRKTVQFTKCKTKYLFSRQSFLNNSGENGPCFAGYIVQAVLCSCIWGKECSNVKQ